MDYIPPKKHGENEYVIRIYFTDDLSRPSLLGKDGNRRTGEGVDDIINLFTTGYHARTAVFGYWHSVGHTILSLKDRDPLPFLEGAIQDFNANYGADYGAWARIVDDI